MRTFSLLDKLESETETETETETENVVESVKVLKAILGNLVKHEHVEKYKKVNIKNKKIAKIYKVLKVAGFVGHELDEGE